MKQNSSLKYYHKMLSILGSLTGLFSESNVPYLNYRATGTYEEFIEENK